ncbi:hypothetical protein [Streptosporangium sp. NPDC051022]
MEQSVWQFYAFTLFEVVRGAGTVSGDIRLPGLSGAVERCTRVDVA